MIISYGRSIKILNDENIHSVREPVLVVYLIHIYLKTQFNLQQCQEWHCAQETNNKSKSNTDLNIAKTMFGSDNVAKLPLRVDLGRS